MTIESIAFTYRALGDVRAIPYLLLAHAVAGIVCALVAGVVSVMRASTVRRPFLAYSERFLVGLALGIVTSLAISIAYGSIGASSPGEAIQNSGLFMSLSLLSLELPIACVVGGLTWHLLSKARGGVPVPARPRREIEDSE